MGRGSRQPSSQTTASASARASAINQQTDYEYLLALFAAVGQAPSDWSASQGTEYLRRALAHRQDPDAMMASVAPLTNDPDFDEPRLREWFARALTELDERFAAQTLPRVTSADHRTVLCPLCLQAAQYVADERSGRMGYSCRDYDCRGSRQLFGTRS